MTPNPLLGVIFHWLGGLASGSFYVPYRGVKRGPGTYWRIGGFFSWIIAPVTVGTILTKRPARRAARSIGFYTLLVLLLGHDVGLGGLTFGLTMRYLGMSLGMAVALGYCAAFGTLMPPIFDGVFVSNVLGTYSGQVILIGVAVCLSGIAFAGKAGMSKEREMSAETEAEGHQGIQSEERHLVATFLA
jgi:L-rhamnose-H+ transport protein